MIPITTPQKNVVLSFFNNDIKLVKRYFMMISFDFDESFQYSIFKDFINAAAGMIKEIDQTIYNAELLSSYKIIQALDQAHTEFKSKSKQPLQVYVKDFLPAQEGYVAEQKKYDALKAELQMLITRQQTLGAQLKAEEEKVKKLKEEGQLKTLSKDKVDKIKSIRRDNVDAIHLLGQRRNEINESFSLLDEFEKTHKAEFVEFFKSVQEKLDYQYSQSLSYFGYEFNQQLFINSEKSEQVQKFKKGAHISGDLNLCKYVEYYLKNINPDALSDTSRKENLRLAKQYCKNQKERANLF